VLSSYPQDVATVTILMQVHSSQLFLIEIIIPPSVFPGQTLQPPPLVAFTAQIPVNSPPAFPSYISLWHRTSLSLVSQLPLSPALPSLSDSGVLSRPSATEVTISPGHGKAVSDRLWAVGRQVWVRVVYWVCWPSQSWQVS